MVGMLVEEWMVLEEEELGVFSCLEDVVDLRGRDLRGGGVVVILILVLLVAAVVLLLMLLVLLILLMRVEAVRFRSLSRNLRTSSREWNVSDLPLLPGRCGGWNSLLVRLGEDRFSGWLTSIQPGGNSKFVAVSLPLLSSSLLCCARDGAMRQISFPLSKRTVRDLIMGCLDDELCGVIVSLQSFFPLQVSCSDCTSTLTFL